MFKYVSLLTICDATFICFMVSWFVCRHILFVIVIKSVYWDAPNTVRLAWNPEIGSYVTTDVLLAFAALLVALEVR